MVEHSKTISAATSAAPAHRRLARNPFSIRWRERIAVLGGAACAVLAALALGVRYAPAATLELLGIVPVTILAVGKFVPLWGITGESHFGAYELGLLVGVLDTLSVVLLVYSLESLYRVAPLRRRLEKVQADARLVLTAYPRMRRAAVAGIVLFVLFPIAGTGAVGATFLGILLGLHRALLIAAVSCGGFLGGLLMAFAAVHFSEAVGRFQSFQSHSSAKYALLAAVALALFTLLWLLRRAYHRALAAAPPDPSAPIL